MADFISSLNGVQMDSALMDMAEHNSEAWAVGERNGIPVGSDDVTYQNNAQYYAQQAQSIAPASVTEAVRWDIAQTALTDANKAQARSNIDAGKNGAWSNRNLLDNAYFVGGGSQLGDGVFPINQRGQSTYTGGGTQLDRWKTWEANDVITLTANGVKFKSPNNNGMFQYWSEFPTTKTVTFSAIIDGNIYSVTLPEGDTQYEYIGTGFKIGISRNGKCVYMNSQNTEILIAACKLEVGTVSTLANDPPPDFGEELRKCQRYLYIPTFPWYAWTGTLAMATSATDFNWVINTPVPMRQGAIPTIGITGSVYINGTAASNLTIGNYPVGNLVKISGTSAGMTSGALYPVNTSADNVSVILSSEL